MRTTRWISLLLATLMVLLAACPAGLAEAVKWNETGYPIFDEPVTMTMWGVLHPWADSGWEDNHAMQAMEELTNIRWEYTAIVPDGYAEKTALMLASGNLPDVLFRVNLNADQITREGKAGTLIPLQEMIPQYMPNLMQMFEIREGLEDGLKDADGNIYALGQVTSSIITYHYVISNKWLENVGMDMPNTPDELYALLKAFKELDANGNGDPNDEIPFSVVGFNHLRQLLGAWGLLASSGFNDMFVYPGTSEIKYALIEEGFKDALLFFQKLYAEGLLDPEFLVQDGTALGAKGNEYCLGMTYTPGAFTTVGEELHDEYDGMEPLINPYGDRVVVGNNPVGIGKFAITKECPYPEAVLRWVDYLYGEEGTILTWGGVEGKTYQWIDENTWDWMLPEGSDVSVVTFRANNTIQGGIGYPSGDTSLFESNFWSHQTNALENSLNTVKRVPASQYATMAYPALMFSSAEQEEIAFAMADIKNYTEQSIADFITGLTDIQSEWDNYVSTVRSMGIDNVIEIYQNKYDAYAAGK